MTLSDLTPHDLNKALIDRLLFQGLDYCGQTADIIIVLGSKKAYKYRIPAAAKLWHEGKAEKLILCGGRVQESPYGDLPEYRSMMLAACECGVPPSAVLTEEKSLTTAENFQFAKTLIEEKFPQCKSVILVTTEYHMRRAYMLSKRILTGLEIYTAPSPGGSTRRDAWHTSEKGIATVHNEVMKLKFYAQNNFIDDMEI